MMMGRLIRLIVDFDCVKIMVLVSCCDACICAIEDVFLSLFNRMYVKTEAYKPVLEKTSMVIIEWCLLYTIKVQGKPSVYI